MSSDLHSAEQECVQSADPGLTLTVDQAASVLGISRGLAYEMIRQDRLPSVRLGRRILVPRSALTRFLNEQSTPGNAP